MRIVKRPRFAINGEWRAIGDVLDVDEDRAKQLIEGHLAVYAPTFAKRTTDLTASEITKKGGAAGKPTPFRIDAQHLDPGPAWVVIPTHNRHQQLRQALASLALQSERPAGVVVVDDGSDDAAAVETSCKNQPFPIRLVRLDKCSGWPNAPRIEGMSYLPKHCMVVELDDHDWLVPGAIEAIRAAMQDGFSFVYGDAVRYAGSGVLFPPDWFGPDKDTPTGDSGIWRCWNKAAYFKYKLRDEMCDVSGARAYRRELYDSVGGWREDEHPAGDAALFLRFEHMLKGEGIVKLPRRLTWFAIHPQSISVRQCDNQQKAFSYYQGLAKTGRLFSGGEDTSFGDPCVKRVGIWISTTHFYSGGRIHMYQIALTLAKMGMEVFIVTNGQPRWQDDYPAMRNLHILIEGKESVPEDMDVILTDSKTDIGLRARAWAMRHEIPLLAMNFETPNWITKYIPDFAMGMQDQLREAFLSADHIMANSNLSAKYLLEWMEREQPVSIIPPRVNTYALDAPVIIKDGPGRPYAVWSGRSSEYKGAQVAIDAVWALDVPFDLVAFGHPAIQPPVSDKHRMIHYPSKPDAEKFALMRGAHVVLAPSKFEGYGMVPGEALAAGTPCIVYDLPVIREAYGDRVTYVPFGDAAGFKAAVKDAALAPKPVIDTAEVCEAYGMDRMVDDVQRVPYLRTGGVSAHMIAYWGVLPEAIESVYPFVDELVIAYGRVPQAPEIDDGSLAVIESFPDPDGKIKLVQRDQWASKDVMRSDATRRMKGDRHLLLDGDEIWTGLPSWLEARPQFGSPRWVNMWGDGNWICDAKRDRQHWGHAMADGIGSTCPHYRWSVWRPSFNWPRHCTPAMKDGTTLYHPANDAAASIAHPGTVIYHLGHVLPAIKAAKDEFYRARDGVEPGTRDTGEVKPIVWPLPAIVERALSRCAIPV